MSENPRRPHPVRTPRGLVRLYRVNSSGNLGLTIPVSLSGALTAWVQSRQLLRPVIIPEGLVFFKVDRNAATSPPRRRRTRSKPAQEGDTMQQRETYYYLVRSFDPPYIEAEIFAYPKDIEDGPSEAHDTLGFKRCWTEAQLKDLKGGAAALMAWRTGDTSLLERAQAAQVAERDRIEAEEAAGDFR